MPWAANSAPWAMHGRAPGDALGGRRGDPIGRPGLALTMTRPDGLTRWDTHGMNGAYIGGCCNPGAYTYNQNQREGTTAHRIIKRIETMTITSIPKRDRYPC